MQSRLLPAKPGHVREISSGDSGGCQGDAPGAARATQAVRVPRMFLPHVPDVPRLASQTPDVAGVRQAIPEASPEEASSCMCVQEGGGFP